MTTLLDENLQSLAEASLATPGQPNVTTLWRWARRGVRGVRLETICIGGRRYTSANALTRFFERLTALSDAGSEQQSI